MIFLFYTNGGIWQEILRGWGLRRPLRERAGVKADGGCHRKSATEQLFLFFCFPKFIMLDVLHFK